MDLPPLKRPRRVTALAYAKLNLHLEVLGRRPDGFHELRSLFQSVSLADRLTLTETRGGLRLRVNRDTVPAGPENLVLRALEALRESFGVRRGADVRLVKRIPVGSGLGGGSADAAAALLAGARLWRLPLGPRRARALALRLGSDVPFCLRGGAAWMGGRGEKPIRRGRLPLFHAVVSYPGFQSSTAEAYRGLKRPLTSKWTESSVSDYSFASFAGAKFVSDGSNDFEPLLLAKYARLRRLKRLFEAGGARGVRLTGSGSAMFGLVPGGGFARALVRRLRAAGFEAWAVFPTEKGVQLSES